MKSTNETEKKAHAKLSPSSSKRWMKCPGSIKLIEQLNIPDKPSRYAAEGTVAHTVHELCLKEGKKAISFVGRKYREDGFQFTVTRDMAEAVQTSVDYIQSRIEDLEMEGFSVELLIEVRASLEFLNVPGMEGGTSDIVIIARNDNKKIVEIEVVDYKHGAGVAVDAHENPQLMSYGLGVCVKHQADESTEVFITVSQPRAFHKEGPIRTYSMTAGQLTEWGYNTLAVAGMKTLEEDAELVPSEAGCRFCPASGSCCKILELMQESAILDFAEEKAQVLDVPSLSSSQKKFVVANAGIIRSFLSSVEEQVKIEMLNGSKDYDDAYKLVRKRTHRKMTESAFDEFESPLFDHLVHQDLYVEKPRTMGEIEKTLKKKVGTKMAIEIMEEVTTKEEGEAIVAPISDSREAIPSSAVADFTATLD